jgi:osmotically inducible protein OsmC
MSTRTASARWQGTLKEGTGVLRTGKGGYEGNFSFQSRFEEGEGTNPEELIGAAHAGCYSMALSGGLTTAGFPPTSVDTAAAVQFERVDGAPTITRIDLTTVAEVPGIDEAQFLEIAEKTKETCPISRLLAPGTEITLSAKLA